MPVNAKKPHKFLDKKNVFLHATNTAVQGLDWYTTNRLKSRGARELNPLARPFVSRGTGTQGLYFMLGGAGIPLGLSYLAHKKGHHKLERYLPMFFAVPSGIAASLNLRF